MNCGDLKIGELYRWEGWSTKGIVVYLGFEESTFYCEYKFFHIGLKYIIDRPQDAIDMFCHQL